jgi:hypothetical protein
MAQELGRVAGAYASSSVLGQDRGIGDRIDMLNLMANELLAMDATVPMPQFSIGYHVVLQKPAPQADLSGRAAA